MIFAINSVDGSCDNLLTVLWIQQKGVQVLFVLLLSISKASYQAAILAVI